ncbi:MAG: hypothetical protein MR008_01800 [Aerococcus sp.]|nr:hypothetical protein [Aerococcus sp.]
MSTPHEERQEIIYSSSLINTLQDSIDEIVTAIERGEQPLFDSVDALFDSLDKKEPFSD